MTPQQVAQGRVEVGLAEPVLSQRQPRRQDALTGTREFAGA